MKVVKRPLPATSLREPKQLRLHGEYVGRTTSVLIVLVILSLGIVYFSEETGNTTATTVNITNSTPTNCFLQLNSGFNMISLNCISNSQDRDQVLLNTDTAVIEAIYEYRNKQTDLWRVYAPNLPSYVVHDLETFSRLKGYFVYVQSGENTLINFTGNLAQSSSIPLLLDNNLVGFPSITNQSLPSVVSALNTGLVRLRHYNGSDWLEFNFTNGTAGGLVNLTPLEGYWFTMNQSDTWQVVYNG